MAGKNLFRFIPDFTLLLFLSLAAVGVNAQSESAADSQLNDIQRRVERARALAAAHQLTAAASELEYVRAQSGGDPALRDGTSIMLMGIYLEDGNYSRAQSLLEETFQARSSGNDSSNRGYYALAGQAVNGLRLHLARYRNFGVSTGEATLPQEALADIDRVRSILERMVAQAKEITGKEPAANDALALLEDVLGIRASLARDPEDRDKWEAEYAAARERLGSARIQIASIGRAPSLGRPAPAQAAPQPAESRPKPSPAQEGPRLVGILNGRATKRVVPSYPPIAKANGTQGVVKVNVTINESGAVQVVNSEGPMLLRQAAEDAARSWQFPPYIVDGKPIKLAGYLEFTFNIK